MLVFFIILLVMLMLIWPKFQRQRKIRRWQKNLSLPKHSVIYQRLYADVDGFTLSRAVRANQDAMEYTYGEIEFESFIALLSLCNPNTTTIFYDLGSGVGKAVIACAMVFNVQKSCGIELFPALHHCAQSQQQRLKEVPNYTQIANHIEFILGNIVKTPFADASLVFINSTAFFGENWLAISKHIEQIKPGALVISTSKALHSNLFSTTKVTQVRMSWGIVNAFIQQRLPQKT